MPPDKGGITASPSPTRQKAKKAKKRKKGKSISSAKAMGVTFSRQAAHNWQGRDHFHRYTHHATSLRQEIPKGREKVSAPSSYLQVPKMESFIGANM